MSASSTLPAPPVELCEYVGDHSRPNPVGSYLGSGATGSNQIKALLPPNWSWEGRRVLDFGCGSGRMMRHFAMEAEVAEFHGCDIDQASISWLQNNLSPPFQGHLTGELPPLPFPAAHFDLIYATSVFTHLTDSWSEWLLELHRLLKEDGLLMVTFIGEGLYNEIAGEPWDEDRVGMNVLGYAQPWETGGPMVFHSPWWIEAHWGRAFEILQLQPAGFVGSGPTGGQGVVVMKRRSVEISAKELESPEPNEPRELIAAQHAIRQLCKESTHLTQQSNAHAKSYYELKQLGARTRLGRIGNQISDKLRPIKQALLRIKRSHQQ